jgi:hypothetical protein
MMARQAHGRAAAHHGALFPCARQGYRLALPLAALRAPYVPPNLNLGATASSESAWVLRLGSCLTRRLRWIVRASVAPPSPLAGPAVGRPGADGSARPPAGASIDQARRSHWQLRLAAPGPAPQRSRALCWARSSIPDRQPAGCRGCLAGHWQCLMVLLVTCSSDRDKQPKGKGAWELEKSPPGPA